MKKFKSSAEAFASQNFDPAKVTFEGVPEQHIEAVRAFVNLCVVHDAVNPEFQPDFSDYDQDKYQNYFLPGSPSGGGFRFFLSRRWSAYSDVGSRLVSENRKAAEHLAEICNEDYKALMVYQRNLKK